MGQQSKVPVVLHILLQKCHTFCPDLIKMTSIAWIFFSMRIKLFLQNIVLKTFQIDFLFLKKNHFIDDKFKIYFLNAPPFCYRGHCKVKL